MTRLSVNKKARSTEAIGPSRGEVTVLSFSSECPFVVDRRSSSGSSSFGTPLGEIAVLPFSSFSFLSFFSPLFSSFFLPGENLSSFYRTELVF